MSAENPLLDAPRSRGSGSQGDNREKTIRRWFVEQDLIESVVLLPDNLFYNTTAAGMIITLNRAKSRHGAVLMINASAEFRKGRPKNELTQEGVQKIVRCSTEWDTQEGFSRAVQKEEIAAADWTLTPVRYVKAAAGAVSTDLAGAVTEYRQVVREQLSIDAELERVLTSIGFPEGGQNA
jgi:type I restriction enzyme M protein